MFVLSIYIKLLSAIDLLFSLFVRDESWTTIPVYKTAILHEIKITCSWVPLQMLECKQTNIRDHEEQMLHDDLRNV